MRVEDLDKLKDIIAKGGLKAMMAPAEGDPFAEDGGGDDGFEPMDGGDGGDGGDTK